MINNKLKIKENSLIDVHTHGMGIMMTHLLSGHYPYAQDILDLSNKARDNNVDYVVTFPMPTSVYFNVVGIRNRKYNKSGNCDYPFQYENLALVNAVEEFRLNNILPFLSFSTHSKIKEQKKSLINLINRYKVFGLKYHATIDRRSVLTNQFREFSEIAHDFNIPILVHTKLDEWAHPNHLIAFSEQNPCIRLCAAHCGHFDRSFFSKLNEKKISNLFIDCSPFTRICYDMSNRTDKNDILDFNYMKPTIAFKQLFNEISSQILWGTDAPFNSFVDADGFVSTYQDEVHLVSDLSIRERLYRNTIRFLYGY